MPWINDVVPYTTVLSTWGNNVRNRVIYDFASAADRDTHNAFLSDGAICYTTDTQTLWTKRAGAWYPLTPATVGGNTYAVTNSPMAKLADVTSPVGFRTGVLVYSGRSLTRVWGSTNAPYAQVDFTLLAGASQIFRTQDSIGANVADYRLNHNINVRVNNNPAVANYYQLNVGTSDALTTRDFLNDGSQNFYG